MAGIAPPVTWVRINRLRAREVEQHNNTGRLAEAWALLDRWHERRSEGLPVGVLTIVQQCPCQGTHERFEVGDTDL